MFTTKTIAAALIAVSSFAAVPASAAQWNVEIDFGGPQGQNWGGGQNWGNQGHQHRHMRRVSTDEVRWMLRDSGYRSIQFFDTSGPVYQLQARKHGRTFFIVVSARDGEILSRQRI